MPHAAQQLAGKTSALAQPLSWAGCVGAAVASVYGALTLHFPPGSLFLFFVLVAGVVAACAVRGELSLRGGLKTLTGLGEGALPAGRENLQAAVKEVSAVADRALWLSLQNWILGAALVSAAFHLLGSGVSWDLAARLWLVGLVFAPISSLFTHLITLLRGRQVVELLADAGLSAQEVIAAVPPRRFSLRARWITLTAISAVTPAILIADLSRVLLEQGMGRMVALSDLALVLGLMAAFGLAIAYLGGTAISGPIHRLADEATRLAKGEVVRARAIPAEDEIWAVSGAFTVMQAHLVEALVQLRRAGLHLGSTTEQILATSGRYEGGAADQASSLNETSATTEELARSARQIAENALSVSDLAQKTWAAADSAGESTGAFGQAMGRMKQDNEAIAGAVDKLNTRVQQIGKIVELINGVAEKSDLLALNAELEGTKAAEVGRGFTLVAAEMRRLAENVLESTQEIEELIGEIRGATESAVAATRAGVQATEQGGALAGSLSQSLQLIVQLAEKTSEAVRSISVGTQQQQAGTDQLAEAMTNILRVTQQNLEATQQVNAANKDLAALSRDLRVVLDSFRVEAGRAEELAPAPHSAVSTLAISPRLGSGQA